MIGPPFDGGEALYAIQHIESHPARGAWIEMFVAPQYTHTICVAPRKGCVDQNLGPSFSENP